MPAARPSTSTAMASRRFRSVSRRAIERSASRRATAVQVLRVAEDGSEVEDVTRYLAPHDVNATTRQVAVSASTAAEGLQRAAVDADANLIVSGAFGYSRLREWFFGGIARDLLAEAAACCLMSH